MAAAEPAVAPRRAPGDNPAPVIVVGPFPPPVHGAARVTELVAGLLRDAGGTVVPVDTSGVGRRVHPRYHLSRLTAHLRAIRTVLRAGGPHPTVYLAGAGGLGLWYQLAVVVAARARRQPIVFHHHNYACLRRRRIALGLLVRAGGDRLTHVVLSESMGEQLRRTYGPSPRVRVCSNAGLLAAPESPRRRRDPAAPIVLGHLSNLSADKGLLRVLATTRRLVASGRPVRLHLAGPAQDAATVRLIAAARAEFGDALSYLGPLAAADVDGFYRALDLFLFPSTYRHEAEPMVVLEAARCGVPTLAIDTGSVAAAVPDRSWLVDPSDDFAAAAERRLRALDDPRGWDAAARAAADHFARRREHSLAAYRELVRSLVGGDRPGHAAGRDGARTLIVEPNPGGHRLEAVAHVARLAAGGGGAVLLTSTGTTARPEFAVHLETLDLVVEECFAGPVPPTREMVRHVVAGCRRYDAGTVVIMDGDLALKTWWWHARELRTLPRRPRVDYFLTRYPARLAITDLAHWRLRAAKGALVAAGRLNGTIARASGFAGREERHRGWLVKRARDPAVCSAHARDRDKLRADLGLPADRRLVGIFGGVNVRKNPALVLDAVVASGLPADLLMAGPVDDRIRQWLDGLAPALRGRVIVADGFHPNELLDRYVAAADVVALVMTLEGPSGIQGKALAAGVPVLTAGSRTRARELRATGGGVAARPDVAGLVDGLLRLEAGAGARATAAPVGLPTPESFAATILGADAASR